MFINISLSINLISRGIDIGKRSNSGNSFECGIEPNALLKSNQVITIYKQVIFLFV